jgi:hypothetical protein
MERQLQIDIYPRKIITRPEVTAPTLVRGVDFDLSEDPYDYTSESFYANGYFRTRRYPILSIEKVELRWPAETALLLYDKEWLRVAHRSGQVNIIATTGGAGPLIIGREGGFLPFLSGSLMRAPYPQLFYVDYTSGIDFLADDNKEYYADLIVALQQRATMGILNDLGRAISPGITSQSLSEDGQSESVSYARGKGGVYGPEIEALNTEVKAFVASFKQATKGIIFDVL